MLSNKLYNSVFKPSFFRRKGRSYDIVGKDYPETYRVFPGQGEAIAFAKSETDRDAEDFFCKID